MPRRKPVGLCDHCNRPVINAQLVVDHRRKGAIATVCARCGEEFMRQLIAQQQIAFLAQWAGREHFDA